MPAYRYEALDPEGRGESGVIDADTPRQARALLRARGLLPVDVDAVSQGAGGAASGWRARFGPRLSATEQAMLIRQLAALLSAGLPLDEVLATLVAQAEREHQRNLLAALRAEVLGGSTLANALAAHPRDFPEIYRALVAAGEQSGKLGEVLLQLADYAESRNALRQRVIAAFTYPAIVTVVAVLIVTFLLATVVPQVVGVYANTRQSLPWMTVLMIALSDFVRHWGWLAALVAVAAVAALRRLLRAPAARLAWDTRWLDLPLFGRLARGIDTERFARTLAILAGAGVPILSALRAAGATMGNAALRADVDDAITRVREGNSLAHSLATRGRFPPVLVHLIRSGEATGRLPEMLERAAHQQAQDLERRVTWLTSLLEPALILVMGLLVTLIVLAVLMPIIDINQMVR